MEEITSAGSQALEIRIAIYELSERGLQQSVKWATEQLVGLPEEQLEQLEAACSTSRMQPETSPRYLLARSYFDLKVRASTLQAHALPPRESGDG